MDKALSLINSLDINNDYIVLACSYGPDSMCLLDLLLKSKLKLVIAHVNHNYRKESLKEYNDLQLYCKKHNIIFEGTTIKEKVIGNQENFYREFRYNYFKEILNKYHAKYLFTAHHGDDLIETILMRISRGSSLKGYGGFKEITKIDNYYIVRPLIYLTKSEILNYVNENKIPYAIDQTNYDDNYTRNKYRHNILPILKEINPQIHEKFLKFSNIIYEYDTYLNQEVESLYQTLYINNHIDLNDFALLPTFMQKCLLKKILLTIYQNRLGLITDKHLDLIINLINNSKANSQINLPKQIIVYKYYNILEFKTKDSINKYNVIFNNKYHYNDWNIIQIDCTNIIKSNYLLRLNSKEIALPLIIRTRNIGDKMSLKNGTKKVGEILSEKKLSKNEREIYPIVTDNKGKILWIPGVKKSKFDKQINEDYDIILKYIKKGGKNLNEKE